MGVIAARLCRILAILVLVIPIQIQIGPAAAPAAAGDRLFKSLPGLNLLIADGTYNGTLASMSSSQIIVSGFYNEYTDLTGYMTVTIAMDHLAVGDLVIKLRGPNGAVIPLLSRPGLNELLEDGCGGSANHLSNDIPIHFDDRYPISAETKEFNNQYFKPARDSEPPPEDLASAFAGEPANGAWTLYVGDACANGKTGFLDSWSLEIWPAWYTSSIPDPAVQGLTFAIDNTSGAGSAIPALVTRYGAGTPLRKVVSRLMADAGDSPDPSFHALVDAYLLQLSYLTPAVSSLTLADFSDAKVILLDDTQAIPAPAGWGSSLDGMWLKPGMGFYFASTEGALVDLDERRTPNRDHRTINNDGNWVFFHTTSAHYVGFARFFQPFTLFMPGLRR